MVLAVRSEALVVGRRRPQEEIPSPESPQVKVEFALRGDKQGTAPLFLQHLPAVGTLQFEVFHQVVEIAAIGIRAKVGPAPQPGKREHGQQLVDIAEHRAQATRGLRRKLVD